MSDRKLKSWQQAGVIDATTAERIRVFEAQNAKPLGLWALIGLGALAVGLGLISVIAANWDAVPGEARLAFHFILMSILAGFIWWRQSRVTFASTDYFNDALLMMLGSLGFTFLGHIGQVYQTSSPLWQPLLLWLVLFSPLLLSYGRGWAAAATWIAVLIVTAFAHADYFNHVQSSKIMTGFDGFIINYPEFYWAVLTCLPVGVLAAASWVRGPSTRYDFWRRLEQISLALIVLGTSVVLILRSFGESLWPEHSWVILLQFLFLLSGAGAVSVFRKTRSGHATAVILGMSASVIVIVNMMGRDEGETAGGILFMLFWGAIAGAALFGGWRAIFQGAIAVLAIRLIIFSFELANDLLGSGLGLIIAGILTLAIAWVAVKISRTYAPKVGVNS
jgi:uncharacterized membrane protein